MKHRWLIFLITLAVSVWGVVAFSMPLCAHKDAVTCREDLSAQATVYSQFLADVALTMDIGEAGQNMADALKAWREAEKRIDEANCEGASRQDERGFIRAARSLQRTLLLVISDPVLIENRETHSMLMAQAMIQALDNHLSELAVAPGVLPDALDAAQHRLENAVEALAAARWGRAADQVKTGYDGVNLLANTTPDCLVHQIEPPVLP